MTPTPQDSGPGLRAAIDALYARMLGSAFDLETGEMRDREVAEHLLRMGEQVVALDRSSLLQLRLFADETWGSTSPPARELRIEGEELVILRGIADAAGHGLMVADQRGNPVFANRALLQLLGFSELRELERSHLSRFYDEPTQLAFEEEIIPAVVAKGRWAGEIEMLATTGERIPTMHILFAVRGEAWREPYIGGLISDIRPQKEALAALRASEENFRTLAENANDGILIATANAEHVFANARAAEMTGYSVPELLRTRVDQLTHPEERDRVLRIFRRRLETGAGPRSYPTRVVRKDGREVQVEVTGARTLWHGQPADIVLLRDISRRREVESALRESEERYSIVVENSCDGVAIAQEERIVFASRPLARLLGYEPSEMVGLHYLDLISPEWREAAKKIFSERMAGGYVGVLRDVPMLRKDGSVARLDAYGSMVPYRGHPALMAFVRAPFADLDPRPDSRGAGDAGEGA